MASMPLESPHDPGYLQNRPVVEFASAPHIGVVVECADDLVVVLVAPLNPNAN
jgi:hypothetical protein